MQGSLGILRWTLICWWICWERGRWWCGYWSCWGWLCCCRRRGCAGSWFRHWLGPVGCGRCRRGRKCRRFGNSRAFEFRILLYDGQAIVWLRNREGMGWDCFFVVYFCLVDSVIQWELFTLSSAHITVKPLILHQMYIIYTQLRLYFTLLIIILSRLIINCLMFNPSPNSAFASISKP